MTKKNTRIAALLCCMIMALGLVGTAAAASTENCPGSCTHQAAIGTTHYDTLAEALTAATDGCTVTVLADASGVSGLTVDKAITLDLGGKALTGAVTSGCFLNVTRDLTLKNGTLTADSGAIVTATNCALTLDKSATVTGNGTAAALIISGNNATATGKLDGKVSNTGSYPAVGTASEGSGSVNLSVSKTAEISSATANALEMHGAGKLDITGGTFRAKTNIILLNIHDNKKMEASVTGGNYIAQTGETIIITITKGTGATAPADFVIGGTYNKVPSAYVPAYCRVTDNGDGTYTVTAEYTVSFQGSGASGTMTEIKADRGNSITLPACSYTAPSGKHFKAWEIGGKEYAPGASYTVNGPVSPKAVWESHYGGTVTCTSKATCSACGASYGTASHKLTSNAGYAATCTQAGMNAHSKCSTCGQYFVSGVSISASSLTTPALGHQMQTVDAVEVTCTEDGMLAHQKCAHCDLLQVDGKDVTQADLIVPASGHQLQDMAAKNATCTQDGMQAHQVCMLCNEYFLEGEVVEPQTLTTEMGSHVLSDWESDETTHWKACQACGEVFRQHSHTDTDADELCDDCGYSLPVIQETEAQQPQKTARVFPLFWILPLVIAIVVALILLLKKR